MLLLLLLYQEYFKTVLEFLKLERIEFGGSMGQSLGKMVMKIFTEFTETMQKFAGNTEQPLNLESKVSKDWLTVFNNNNKIL